VERRSVDITSLVAGLVVVAFGVLLLLDRTDVLNLSFGWFWPAIAAAVGTILLASGLTRGR
jgi:cell wall-active antibiotic response 4TMS protein YvqF